MDSLFGRYILPRACVLNQVDFGNLEFSSDKCRLPIRFDKLPAGQTLCFSQSLKSLLLSKDMASSGGRMV